jgi:hypothetical protein
MRLDRVARLALVCQSARTTYQLTESHAFAARKAMARAEFEDQ